MLVVDPKQRMTAIEALEHPFFKREVVPKKKFNAKRTFKVINQHFPTYRAILTHLQEAIVKTLKIIS